ncbi:HAD-IA family hydrolase [Brevundimonas sp. PAMC22021]|uniref:HAD-IA family hydrolase n=1 Tax=Brevundimonas sp. PAMC22021 TaxID=2861285 RepID=UPI001C62E118|nr:HAD-IA family hydrolase [Brevundimonas sp. PAMC22021]QYF88070.1 HAD-IA family hydrolase [Brevundimonas sp. PAMC22021]
MTERDLEGWTLVFDLDGTLVDSAPDLIGTLNRLLVEEGLPPVEMEAAQTLIGSGARALLVYGFEAAGGDMERARSEALFERFLTDYRAHIVDGTRAYEGVEETLDRLSARGARLVVATNKRTDLSELLMQKLELASRFAAVVGPERVSARKPSGAHLTEAVQIVGGDPARAIMVGDAAPDADAARDAGLPCILTTFGYTPVPVEQLGADVLIDTFEDVEEAVDAIVSSFYVRRAMGV